LWRWLVCVGAWDAYTVRLIVSWDLQMLCEYGLLVNEDVQFPIIGFDNLDGSLDVFFLSNIHGQANPSKSSLVSDDNSG
jgi:hypothetical protein